MFDNNYDKNEGVSIWGHVLDGAATGAAGGALFGGVGAIPGALVGGLAGLGTGLWDDHQDAVAEEQWKKDANKLAPDSKEARALEKSMDANADTLFAEHKDGPIDSAAMANQALERTYHQQQAAKIDREGGGSFWDGLF
jgi:hypothetical protein